MVDNLIIGAVVIGILAVCVFMDHESARAKERGIEEGIKQEKERVEEELRRKKYGRV